MSHIINLRRARLDPAAVFHDPEQVASSLALTPEQKVDILRRWEYDARQLDVATEENMQTGNGGDLLDRILAALLEVGYVHDVECFSPAKGGGSWGAGPHLLRPMSRSFSA